MDAYKMVLFPSVFIVFLIWAFDALTPDTNDIDTNFTVLTNSTIPEPSATWYGQTDFLGYFVSIADFIGLKAVALFNIAGNRMVISK